MKKYSPKNTNNLSNSDHSTIVENLNSTKQYSFKIKPLVLAMSLLGGLSIQTVVPVAPMFSPLSLGYAAETDVCDPADIGFNDNDDDECQYAKPDADASQGGQTADNNAPCVQCGEPIDTTTGNMYESQTDYKGSGAFPLELTRYYNSQATSPAGNLGANWSLSFGSQLQFTSPTVTKIVKSDGRIITFSFTNGSWLADAGVNARLQPIQAGNTVTGWRYITGSENIESYDASGKLIAVSNRAGLTQNYSYDTNNRLAAVTDHFGRKLSFAYDANNRIVSVKDPADRSYGYTYDANNNLISVIYPDNTSRNYLYENRAFPHALTGLVDEKGVRYVSWTYDNNGLATSSAFANNVDKTSFAYDFSQGFTVVTDALGNKTNLQFVTFFGLARPVYTTQPQPFNAVKSQFYDPNGNVGQLVDYNGNTTNFTYDKTRNLEISRTEAIGTAAERTITTTWNPDFRLPATIAESNRSTSFTYDDKGNLLKKVVSDGSQIRAWAYTYNANGQLLSFDGPRTDVNDVTRLTYDTQGNLNTITDAMGHVTSITSYNVHGQPLRLRDSNGLISSFQYDTRNRLASLSIGKEVTKYTYDAAGQITKITLPDASFLTYSYDDAHRLTGISDALGNQVAYTLDLLGNRLKTETFDPKKQLASTQTQAFDSLQRLSQSIGAESQAISIAYDHNGNMTSVTDPLNQTTNLTYDSLNRLTKSIDPAGNNSQSTYDANDNLLSVTDPLMHKTQNVYDGLDNQLSLGSPDTGLSKFSYDSAGNKISTVDARGKQVNYAYDSLNRLTKMTYDGDRTINFLYDQGRNGIGHLTQMNDETGMTRWQFDGHGRIVGKTFQTGDLSLITKYGYNAQGQLTTMTYPSGKTIHLTYNKGLLTALDVNGNPLLSGIHYQPFGAVSDWIFGNGSKAVRDFDLDGRISAYDLGERNRTLSYDAASRIVSYKDTDMQQDQSFAYDAASRLLGITTPISQTDYAYDANGNRTSLTANGSSLISEIGNTNNQLLTVTQNAVPIKTNQYDLSGNIINDGSHSFSFDGRGRLVKASGNFGSETYRLNGLGQRIAKLSSKSRDLEGDANQDGRLDELDLRLIVLMTQGKAKLNLAGDCDDDGKITNKDALYAQSKIVEFRENPNVKSQSTTYFVNDESGHLMGEYNPTGRPIRETVWLGDTPVAVLQNDKAYFVYADHLNTPRAISDSTGKTVWRWDSDAFGATPANEDPDQDGKKFTYNLRFPGQYFDQSTGLHYNGFRDYDPTMGRYIESDPIGLAGGINTYGYVHSNPLNVVDESGLVGITINLFNPNYLPDRGLYLMIESLRPFVKDGEVLIGAHGGPGQLGYHLDNGTYEKYTSKQIIAMINKLDPSKSAKTVTLNACNSGKDYSGGLSAAQNLFTEDKSSRTYIGAKSFYYPDGIVADMYDKTDGSYINFKVLTETQINNSYRIPVTGSGYILIQGSLNKGGLGG